MRGEEFFLDQCPHDKRLKSNSSSTGRGRETFKEVHVPLVKNSLQVKEPSLLVEQSALTPPSRFVISPTVFLRLQS